MEEGAGQQNPFDLLDRFLSVDGFFICRSGSARFSRHDQFQDLGNGKFFYHRMTELEMASSTYSQGKTRVNFVKTSRNKKKLKMKGIKKND